MQLLVKLRIRLTAWVLQILNDTLIWVEKALRDPGHVQTVALWASAITAGLSAVAFAKCFRLAERSFHKLVAAYTYAPFLVTPIMFLLAWYIVRRFAPEASGSGIPQIMAANEMEYVEGNRSTIDRLLSLKTGFVKICSALLCELGGGAIGREGPTLQISASIFHFFGQQTRRFLPNVNEHTWVVAGAASGLASAFNTPLGGIVYAIEELGLVHFHKVRTALISGVIVSGLVAQWLLGSYLYLGYPELTKIGFSFLPTSLLSGIISGLLGAAFGRILLSLVKSRLTIQNPRQLALVTALCGISFASLIALDPRAAGTGIDVTTGFLFSHDHADPALVAIRFLGTLISYLSGAAGGIFSPALSIGATVGSYLSTLIGQDHENLMVLLGMIGFLTGVTRTPFTSFILVLEMTDRHSAIFPMMVCALAAQSSAHFVDPKSFYEHMKARYMVAPKPSPPSS